MGGVSPFISCFTRPKQVKKGKISEVKTSRRNKTWPSQNEYAPPSHIKGHGEGVVSRKTGSSLYTILVSEISCTPRILNRSHTHKNYTQHACHCCCRRGAAFFLLLKGRFFAHPSSPALSRFLRTSSRTSDCEKMSSPRKRS